MVGMLPSEEESLVEVDEADDDVDEAVLDEVDVPLVVDAVLELSLEALEVVEVVADDDEDEVVVVSDVLLLLLDEDVEVAVVSVELVVSVWRAQISLSSMTWSSSASPEVSFCSTC